MKKSYRDLKVWQKAIDLGVKVYAHTQGFPNGERYGLTLQMRKSAVSVASNIAEGCARNGEKEFCHFVGIARGSVAELTTQTIIAHRIGYLEKEPFHEVEIMTKEISKMLSGLKSSITKPVATLVKPMPLRTDN